MILSGYSLNNILNFNRTLVHKILKNRLCEYSLSFMYTWCNHVTLCNHVTWCNHVTRCHRVTWWHRVTWCHRVLHSWSGNIDLIYFVFSDLLQFSGTDWWQYSTSQFTADHRHYNNELILKGSVLLLCQSFNC